MLIDTGINSSFLSSIGAEKIAFPYSITDGLTDRQSEQKEGIKTRFITFKGITLKKKHKLTCPNGKKMAMEYTEQLSNQSSGYRNQPIRTREIPQLTNQNSVQKSSQVEIGLSCRLFQFFSLGAQLFYNSGSLENKTVGTFFSCQNLTFKSKLIVIETAFRGY